MAKSSSATQRSIRHNIIAGMTVFVILAGAVGGWAGTTALSGALIAPGQVVVDSNVKKVQHPTGGVVGELRVRDGDRVKGGEIVMRLDQTVTRSNLAIITKGLDELSARKARLSSERDGADAMVFPDPLMSRRSEPDVAQIMDSERKLFDLRKTSRSGQKAQLRQQVEQLQEEIVGMIAQQRAKKREVELITRELEGVRDLFQRNLVQINRLTQLEREATRVDGEQAQLTASVAQAKGKIAETELKVIQIDQDLSSEVAKEMREIDAKIGEFIERKIAAQDQLQRVDIRSPQDGTVFQLTVHTVGGVIACRRSDHADRSECRQSDRGSQGQSAGYRASAAGAEDGAALSGIQCCDYSGDRRSGQQNLRRHKHGSAHRSELLYDSDLNPSGSARAFGQR